MSYNFKDLEAVTYQWATATVSQPVMTVSATESRPNNITLINKGVEMLRVAEDGFYVRGEKIPVDDKEASTVYNAFKEFLVWNRLSRE
jgi:hypothetical protein